MKQPARYFLALLLLIAGAASARAETVFRVEYHPDPCQQAAALGKGKTATVGKVNISLEPFYYAACERVRVQIVDSIQARAEAFRGDLEADLKSRVAPLYDGFLKWMSLELYDRLSDAEDQAGRAFSRMAAKSRSGTLDLRQLLHDDANAARGGGDRALPE